MVSFVNITACLQTGSTASRAHAEEQAWGQLHGEIATIHYQKKNYRTLERLTKAESVNFFG